MLFSLVLYCPVIYCPILYCPVLYCSTLFFTVLSCPTLSCHVLYSPVLHYSVLSCPFLSCTFLYCTVLLCPVIPCSADFHNSVPSILVSMVASAPQFLIALVTGQTSRDGPIKGCLAKNTKWWQVCKASISEWCISQEPSPYMAWCRRIPALVAYFGHES